MSKKQTTIEHLAQMVQRGFEETAKKREVDHQFSEVYKHFDKIEKLLIAEHSRRIEKLEMHVKELRDLLAVK